MRRRSKLSTFKRPPAGICDPEASYSDFTCAHPHDLTTRCGAPIVDQVGYHGDSKPMGEQRRPGAAAQPHSREYLERPALFCTEVGFSRRDGDDVRRGWHRGKSSGGQVRGNGCPVKDIPSVSRPPVADGRMANLGQAMSTGNRVRPAHSSSGGSLDSRCGQLRATMPRISSSTAPISSSIDDVDSDDAMGSACAAAVSSSTTNQRRLAARRPYRGLTPGPVRARVHPRAIL